MAVTINLGEVFVAHRVQRIIGHVQLIAAGADWEIKSVAVIEKQRVKVSAPRSYVPPSIEHSPRELLAFWLRPRLRTS